MTSNPGQPATRQPGGIPTVVSNLESQVDVTALMRSLAAEPTVGEAMGRTFSPLAICSSALCGRDPERGVRRGLPAEMNEHLGYDKGAPEGRNRGNSRNGKRTKTVVTDNAGPVDIVVPRDRDGTFEPVIEGLPPGADGTPDVDWVVAALPLLMERARRGGQAFLCEDCADESGSAVTDAALLVDLYGTNF